MIMRWSLACLAVVLGASSTVHRVQSGGRERWRWWVCEGVRGTAEGGRRVLRAFSSGAGPASMGGCEGVRVATAS